MNLRYIKPNLKKRFPASFLGDIFYVLSVSNLLNKMGGYVTIDTVPWSSLVEEDEQLDRPNSKTSMQLCHACVA